MTATTLPTRFIPCPICRGAGGHTEIVCEAGGPYYPCMGCNGSGNLRDYLVVRDERAAQNEADAQVMCDCGHDATQHYSDYGGAAKPMCAFCDDTAEEWTFCRCRRSYEDVIRGLYPMAVAA